MADNIDELHRKIKDLEGEVAYLNAQLKQDNLFGLHWIDVPEAFEAGEKMLFRFLRKYQIFPSRQMMENLLIYS